MTNNGDSGGRMISLAAGVCPDADPVTLVEVCAEAGWPACGVWFDAATWTDDVADRVAARLDETGLVALDFEPVYITAKGDNGDRMLDAAARVGAQNVLMVGHNIEPSAFADRYHELCAMAVERGLWAALEFAPIFDIGTLEMAVGFAQGIDGASILVDNLHLDRSGGSAADLAAVDPSLFRYSQISDAPVQRPVELMPEARDGRLGVGEGGLPVADVVRALPDGIPLSVELRSEDLRKRIPDLVERATHVRATTEAWLEHNDLR